MIIATWIGKLSINSRSAEFIKAVLRFSFSSPGWGAYGLPGIGLDEVLTGNSLGGAVAGKSGDGAGAHAAIKANVNIKIIMCFIYSPLLKIGRASCRERV